MYQKKKKTWTKILAVTTVMAFVGAACGGDDDDSAESTPAASEAPTVTTAAPATTEAATDETDAPSDETDAPTDETDAPTDETDAPTDETDAPAEPSGEFGLIDGIYVGAGGFELDPALCPEDWDPNQGITDTEIKLFESLPTSGPLAGFALIPDGARAYWETVNAAGGIDGREIVLDIKDDVYTPDKTKANVDEAVQSGEYAALWTVLGTPHNLAVWDSTNDECMPQLLTGSGAAQWGDVENHPWTTGMQLDYFSEAGLWAEWLKSDQPDLKKVAMLTFNNDFGKSYAAGFKFAIEGSDIEVVTEEIHEPTAPNLTNQFTSLAASGAEVLLLQTTGAFCTQGMGEIEKGSWKPLVIMSATCGSLTQFFKPLIDQGLTGQGTHIIQTFKDLNDPEFADDEFMIEVHEFLDAAGLDSTQSTYGTGVIFAWYMVEILNLASTYEGGLDRGNIMLAARAIQETNPLLLDGLTSKMNGLEDAYLTEGGRMVQYTVTDPSTLGSYTQVGDLIDNEGKTGTYASVVEAMGG